MPTNEELLKAILAMDSYNREYEAGLQLTGSQVGLATFHDHIALGISPDQYGNWQKAGFYAAAYTTPYGTVISYRGTDKYFGDDNIGGDILNGWVTGVGWAPGSQAQLALQF